MNILENFLERAPKLGARAAIIEGSGRAASFADLVTRSAAVAGAWRSSGLQAGERVLVAMPLGIELYIGLAALWRIGAVAVFPEPSLGLSGLRHAARATQPHAFLTGGWYGALRAFVPELQRVARVLHVAASGEAHDDSADLPAGAAALISFTSGSTGAPKAIVRTHGFLAAQNASVATLIAPQRETEIDLVAFPVFVIVNLGLGVTSVLPNWNLRRHHKARSCEIITHIQEQGVTRALIPPSICEILAMSGKPTGLSHIFTGGGPVFPDMIERLQAQNQRCEITAVYGSTEAEPIAHIQVKDICEEDWRAMRGGAGLLAGAPSPDVQVMLIDDEIIVTGEHVNKGYLDPAHNESTKLEHCGKIWHRTGDAGRLDAQGRLWLLGRHGQSAAGIYPFSVETAARFWPGVKRAALVRADKGALLIIEGDGAEIEVWRRAADTLAGLQVMHVRSIPLDKRHRSKVDYAALRRWIEKRR